MLPENILRSLLLPVVRFFVRHGISIHDFSALAKTLYVTAAQEELERSDIRQSISRISAITGLNRRDIASIQGGQGKPHRQGASLIARVLGAWEVRNARQSRSSMALSCDGEDSEFYALVRSISRDIHPSAVLIELVRSGLVIEESGSLRMNAREAIVPKDAERGWMLLAKDTDTLIKVIEENVTQDASIRNLHLRTEFDNIARRDVPELKRWLLEEAKEFHRRARQRFADSDLDMSSAHEAGEGGGRVVLTSFGFAAESHGKQG